MFLKKSFSEAKQKGLPATKRGDLVNTLHIVHLERRCGFGVGGSFHQNCYFDEHPPPLWAGKAVEQQGARGSSRVIEPFNPDPETCGSNN